ncbi:MAG TPA: phytoene/squalene synthase family protein [Immundisolibacter sp.]|nr:phytoene/squalene synthase family protein [Immundisolibacter sp.]
MNAPLAAFIQHHSKSFALASRLLPPAVRADVLVLYAWCRRADDTVDLAADPAAGLARLQAELDDVYAGRPAADPLLDAFAQVVQRCELPRHYPQELLAGMGMDLEPALYADHAALALYCYRVAGVVGLMMCHVMGVSDDAALEQAAQLGMAMQLTNICRDVAEDWQRGRLYLPYRALGFADEIAVRAALAGPIDADLAARLPAQVRDLLARADAYYRCGMGGIGALDWRCGLAVRAAAGIYRGIGAALARQGYQPLAGRAYLPGWRKAGQVLLALAGQCGATAGARAATRVPARQVRFGPELCL